MFSQINWKVRFNNFQFIVQLFLSIILPILTYAGLTLQDLTSWAILGNTLLDALSNPYVLGLIVLSVYNAIVDPTTRGLFDSSQALTYTKPKKVYRKVR